MDRRVDEVRQLYARCRELPFPNGLRGADIDGVDLVLVSADVAGCVHVWLKNSGQLDARRWKILHRCLNNLDRILPQLTRPDAIAYFTTYRATARLVRESAPA